MKVLIVDDEALARARLKYLLDEMSEVDSAAEAANGRQALLFCLEHTPDVVLLDIRMPDMDGLEVARHLLAQTDKGYAPAIIFTTAFGDHALEAFEIQAMDYLLKPIRRERLLQALHKATQMKQLQLQALLQNEPQEMTARSHLCIRQGEQILLISVHDIYYFQADQKYVSVWYQGQEYLLDESLKALEQEFGDQFIRIHRNALVSRRHLTGLRKSSNGNVLVLMADVERQLEVSRRHLPVVRKLLKNRGQ